MTTSERAPHGDFVPIAEITFPPKFPLYNQVSHQLQLMFQGFNPVHKNIIFLAFAMVLPISPSAAHQDTLFQRSANGSLGGLPHSYLPASLGVVKAGDGQLVNVTLVLSGQRNELPQCLAQLFDIPDPKKMTTSGSWYHDLSLLPPYLSINLPTQTAENGFYDGHSLLFNLKTADLIQVQRHRVGMDSVGMSYEDINLSNICTAEEIEQLQITPSERPAPGRKDTTRIVR